MRARRRAADFADAACNHRARRSSSPGWVVWTGGGPRARVGGAPSRGNPARRWAKRFGVRAARAGVLVFLATSPVPGPAAAAARHSAQLQDSAVEREWHVRAAALELPAHAATLATELAAEAWRARAAALDALARGVALGDPVPPACAAGVVAALTDPHPNVRARALAAATGLASAPPVDALAAAAVDPLPVVRLALAHALPELAARGLLPAADVTTRLATLADDRDARVGRAASAGLLGLASDDAAVRTAQVAWLAGQLAGPEALEVARSLARSSPSAALVDAAVAGALARGAPPESLLAALAWGLGSAPSPARTPAAFLAGWTADVEPRVETLLRLAARSRDGGLARAVLAALGALGDDDPRRADWADLFVELLGAPEATTVLLEAAPSPAVTALVLEGLGRRLDALPLDPFATWTESGRPTVVRRAMLDAAVASHSRTQDAATRRLLARFLDDEDPGLARRAGAALCGAREVDPEVDRALHAYWRALPESDREARLGDFTRERPFAPFRADWLALGARGGGPRRAACELLAPFGPDTELAEVVASWLAVDVARLAEQEPTRALEFEVQADLRALRVLAGPDVVGPFAGALDVALGRSTEVGKVACAALGRRAAGRTHLAARLAEGAFARDEDRRTRIEAAIVLALGDDETARRAAVAILIADHDAAAPDLLERMLDALAASREPAAFAALSRWALDPAVEPVERTLVLEGLALARAPEAADTAEAAARSRLDLETRRAGVRALGTIGGAEAAQRLQAVLATWFPPGTGEAGDREASGFDPETAAVVRGDVLEALGRTGHFPARLEPEWLAGPLRAAEPDLVSRLDGEGLAATEFRWRAELALAGTLARARRLPRALEAAGPWWHVDASFLLVLGERLAALEECGDIARSVLRAALVGLAGEGDPPVALIVRARAALLELERRAGHSAAAARLAADLLAQRRSGEADETMWARLFGTADGAR